MKRVRCIAAFCLLVLAASADQTLQGGQWDIRNTPGVATLDGRALSELPIGEIKTQTMCLPSLHSAGLARFLTTDLGEACKVATSTIGGGKVRIGGTCPNELEGPDATFELTGKYDSDGYVVDFATTAVGNNGRMTFSGQMAGKRTGSCTAPAPSPAHEAQP